MKTLFARYRRKMATGFLPETEQWLSAVKAAGGSVSNATLAAVDNYARQMFNADLWKQVLECGLFVGDNLATALIKFKYPANRAGTLVNVNFVEGDYAESGSNGGLNPNGSTKYLKCGTTEADLGANGHLAFYLRADLATGSYRNMIGGNDASNEYALLQSDTGIQIRYNQTRNVLVAGLGKGFYCGSRISLARLDLYKNGVSIGNNTGTATNPEVTREFYVFTGNNDGSPLNYLNVRGSYYSLGYGLNAAEMACYNAIVQELQTAFNRNV